MKDRTDIEPVEYRTAIGMPRVARRKRYHQLAPPCDSEPPIKRSRQPVLVAANGISSNIHRAPGNENDLNTTNIMPTLAEGSVVEIVPLPAQYDPELSVDQNPFYYEPNKLLNQLHAERLKRKVS